MPGKNPFAAVNACLVCYIGIFLNLIQSSAVRQYLGWVGQSLLEFIFELAVSLLNIAFSL